VRTLTSSFQASLTFLSSTIKVWDLRKSHSWRANPVCVESNEDVVASSESARSRGISSMVLAPDGRRLYAYSTDARFVLSPPSLSPLLTRLYRIFAFDALNITQPAPLAIFHHSQTVCGSFYLRLAVSPCSRYLANGSSNGAVYLYDTEGKGDDGVRVVGHESEISGISWGKDRVRPPPFTLSSIILTMMIQLATCSDDNIVRVWSPNQKIARARVNEEVRRKWAGEMVGV
jgi:WD40 repeat protein